MSVKLLAIAFNHDPNSATHDALNIRKDNDEFVIVPEWRRGATLRPRDSVAAYAIEETRGRTITIRAKFSTDESGLRTVEARAIQPPSPRLPFLGTLGTFLPWPYAYYYDWLRLYDLLSSGRPPTPANVLGQVKARRIEFGPGGETELELFELENLRLANVGVGINNVTWRWQIRRRPTAPWTDLTDTHHRIYTVLRTPTAPWSQEPYDVRNSQLPWTEAMDFSCLWARGARDLDEAAARVTSAVFDLGPEVVSYDCFGGGSTHYTGVDPFTPFNCTNFLARLHGTGGSYFLNCIDCATISSTFANILGCDLSQSGMFSDFGVGVPFQINPIIPIGSSSFGTACGFNFFVFHEVAWKGACTADDAVFDACLLVNGGPNPTRPPRVPMLAANLRFGVPGEGQYRDRLATPAGRPNCQPQPLATRLRRWVI